ncbi:unnamed protein product [Tuber aestivum]|uniref:RNA helicase n=1 Tax=Tuber aestivum TaxID=59557 RepID=A0A292PSD4_9PEZI|nr:unnamed protein product [Tuber aestivum]
MPLSIAAENLKRKSNAEEFQFLETRVRELGATGLRKAHFRTLTDIPRKAILLPLKGPDVPGTAKTGSGKMLASLVPVRELPAFWCAVRSLTRAGFGNSLSEEMDRCGWFGPTLYLTYPRARATDIRRSVKNEERTVGLMLDNVQGLVLDEANRILDMGFLKTLDGIIENLPKERQTLLFSGTQMKSLSDLAS